MNLNSLILITEFLKNQGYAVKIYKHALFVNLADSSQFPIEYLIRMDETNIWNVLMFWAHPNPNMKSKVFEINLKQPNSLELILKILVEAKSELKAFS